MLYIPVRNPIIIRSYQLISDLADSDIDQERREIFIIGDEHARLDGRSQVKQNIVTIFQNDCRWRECSKMVSV